ncbi:MAG: hypothetical protein AAFR38_02790 [Planctomycetota bacterium]
MSDVCAECGYDLAGLAEAENCPECGSDARERFADRRHAESTAFLSRLTRISLWCQALAFVALALLAFARFETAAVWAGLIAIPVSALPFAAGVSLLATQYRELGVWSVIAGLVGVAVAIGFVLV